MVSQAIIQQNQQQQILGFKYEYDQATEGFKLSQFFLQNTAIDNLFLTIIYLWCIDLHILFLQQAIYTVFLAQLGCYLNAINPTLQL